MPAKKPEPEEKVAEKALILTSEEHRRDIGAQRMQQQISEALAKNNRWRLAGPVTVSVYDNKVSGTMYVFVATLVRD